MTPSAERHLVRLYVKWLDCHHLPQYSADEVVVELYYKRQHVRNDRARRLIDYQVAWLSRFIDIWRREEAKWLSS